MSRYAAGTHSKGISDRSGRAYPLRVMLKEWNGSLVGPDEYESKQPQIEPKRVRSDPQALRTSRPDSVEPAVADRKSTRLNSSHWNKSRMPSSA